MYKKDQIIYTVNVTGYACKLLNWIHPTQSSKVLPIYTAMCCWLLDVQHFIKFINSLTQEHNYIEHTYVSVTMISFNTCNQPNSSSVSYQIIM